jgi:hypothetical protein
MANKGKGFLKGHKAPKNNDKYKKFIGNRSEGKKICNMKKAKPQSELDVLFP